MKIILHSPAVFFLILSLFILGCSPASSASVTPADADLLLAVTPTVPLVATPTFTPEPPTATPNLTAIAQTVATEQAAAFLKSIQTDLELAGFDMESGQLAFIQPHPTEIKVVDTVFGNLTIPLTDPNPVLANFVLGVDIQLELTSEITAHCPILFRGEADYDNGERVVFGTGFGMGRSFWNMALQVGHGEEGDWRRTPIDVEDEVHSDIDIKTGIHYVLVAEAATITVYANGQRLGSAPITVANREGVILLQAFQDGGVTTCTFSNVWVWELND